MLLLEGSKVLWDGICVYVSLYGSADSIIIVRVEIVVVVVVDFSII